MTSPIDWDSDQWGQPGTNVHVAADCPDRHDASEQRAEETRG